MLENKNVTGNSKIGVAISAILMLFEFIVSILAPITAGKQGVANLTYLTIHNCFNIIINVFIIYKPFLLIWIFIISIINTSTTFSFIH